MQEERKVITMAMFGKIQRMHYRDGLSLSEIARRTSVSRNAIKKWIREPEGTEPRYRENQRESAARADRDGLAHRRGTSPIPRVSGITEHSKRARLYSTVDLVNMLELEEAAGKQGKLAFNLMRMDLVILDELGYLPFSQAGGALLFHLLSKLYERTSVMITTNLTFAE